MLLTKAKIVVHAHLAYMKQTRHRIKDKMQQGLDNSGWLNVDAIIKFVVNVVVHVVFEFIIVDVYAPFSNVTSILVWFFIW